MTETILTVLKFLAIAVSGIAGVIAIVGETRNSDGHLTRWGKLMLGGILVSILVASAIQVEEIIKQKHDAEESARKARETVQELQSPLMPAGRMAVSFLISVKLDHPALKAYRDRVAQLLAPAMNSSTPPQPPRDSNWWLTTDLGNNTTKVTGVQFGPSSPFYPQVADGPQLSKVFDYFGVEGHIGTGKSRGGIQFHALPKDGHRTYRILSLDAIEFEVEGVELRPGESWRTDNSIVSLPQLKGKDLTVDFIGFDWGTEAEINLGLELQKVATIGYFKFLAANRQFFISGGPPN